MGAEEDTDPERFISCPSPSEAGGRIEAGQRALGPGGWPFLLPGLPSALSSLAGRLLKRKSREEAGMLRCSGHRRVRGGSVSKEPRETGGAT